MPSKKYNNGRRREKNESDNDIVGIVLIIISAFILLCIVVRPVLGFISLGIFNVVTGVFGLFSYPLFFSTLILGIALLQGRRTNLPARYKIGIICSVISLMFILQLATSHSLLGGNFSSYISGVYSQKTTAGGVLFGAVAYAVQSVVSPVVSYVLFSITFVASVGFFIVLPIYSKRRKAQREDEQQQINPFVKGLAAPQQIKPVNDNTLFVDTIIPSAQGGQLQNDVRYTPINTAEQEPKPKLDTVRSSGVQFEPYGEKKASHDGYKSKAHEILFGNRRNAEIAPPSPPIDFAKAQSEYMASFGLPPLVSEPDIKSKVSEPAVRQQKPEPPAKPQKTVHNISSVGLAEIPLLPEKDITNQIVRDGTEIVNGDDLSRRLAETLTPVSQEKKYESPRANDFSTRKIELTSVQPKSKVSEEERPSIVNGDYFGMPAKSRSSAPAPAPIVSAPVQDEYEQEQSIEQEDEGFVQEPIITGSEYEKRLSPEKSFFAELEDDRKSKRNAEPARTMAFSDEPEEENDFVAEESPFADELDKSEREVSLMVDEPPVEPRKSSFNIIEEPIDLSEKTHLSGEDNTGYYNTVSFDVKPARTDDKTVLRSQLKIDDYVADKPAPIKPKKKKRVRYNPPDIDMLIASDSYTPENSNAACEEKARILEETLQELKLPAKVNGITRGPAVTRFELEMPPGIPIKRIESLSTDIAYNLASNGKIRIEAPIPGKRAVGIEVPNEEIDIVRLREIIESKEFTNSSSPLTLALGKDIAGANITCNLEKMPHLLIAGATGSGKSACLNSIIISILYKSSPEDVRMILIDPKRVEFNMYQGIPHLMGSEIINDAQQAINVLTWAKEEMDRRYTLFGNHRVRNLPEFNKSEAVKSGEEPKLPYIVLIVDELAELMLDNNKKVLEGKIMSIAQKARAAGIHLILATQRPSVDVITGTIKANLPSRIAFTVKSIVDSRTILDECGAETLLGRGDMLYSPVGMDDPKRVQGAFVTDKEVLAISEYVRENNEADFDEEFATAIAKRNDEPETDGDEEEGDKEFDSLMPEVLKCVIESGSASTSMIQRRFSVGYARASRIIDQMELHKFIGPLEGSKPRAVYISREQYKELFGTDL